MKSSTVVLGLSALAMAWPGMAEAKRLREPADAASSASSAATVRADDDFARLDLNLLPAPGASAEPVVASGGQASAGGMSTQLSWPRAERSASPEIWSSNLPAPQASALPRDSREARPGGDGPRFDLVVNNAPAAQVFVQMGAGAGVNVLVPPEIKGNVSVNLRAVTLSEAMEAFRELYGYDFKVSGNRVYVYPNTIQTRIYQINYLAATREGASTLRVSSPGQISNTASSSASGSSSASSSSGSSGSTPAAPSSTGSSSGADATRVQMNVSTDFWRDLNVALKDMLASGGPDRSVVVNPAGGMLVVRASPAEHRQVAEYLKALRLAVQRQVMLEAKIVEVTLSNESQSGVNWSMFRSYSNGGKQYGVGTVGAGVTLNQGSGSLSSATSSGNTTASVTVVPGSGIAAELGSTGFYGLALQAGNFAALLNFLSSQGDVQVLSSPRIATLNNQKAVLKVGTDAYYPTSLGTSNSSQSATTGTVINITAPSVNPMFQGIVLDVTPRIDADGAILLHVHPIISDISVEPFTYYVGSFTGGGPLPKISVSETDSIVRVLDRQIVAIGGLMRTQQVKNKSGLAGLSDLPIIGGLFRQKSVTTVKQELVVLIKPTVIGADGEGFERDEPQTSSAE